MKNFKKIMLLAIFLSINAAPMFGMFQNIARQDIIHEQAKQSPEKINQAKDLTKAQKELLLNAFKQLNLIDIFTKNNYDSIKNISKIDIPEKLLIQYFPLGLWINKQHQKLQNRMKKMSDISNLFEVPTSSTLQNVLTQWQTQKNLTLTEQLLINLASQHQALGRYAIFSDKNSINNETEYYAAGFAGDLLQLKIIEQVCQAEKELHAQGFETFFHGRAWEWNFVNDIWNIICKLKTNASNSEKIRLRFRKLDCDVAQLQQYRQDLITNGPAHNIGTSTCAINKESEVTFMNKTVISNPGNNNLCTGIYVLDNYSVSGAHAAWTMTEKIFELLDLSSYFEQNKQTLKALYYQHLQASKFGELLCIAVKKEHLNGIVYPAESGGIKVPGTASEHIKNCKQNALVHKNFHDTDHSFYCLAVSDIPGEYGTKYIIKSLHVADPEKYAAYKQARDAFAAKLKAYLQTSAQG